MAINPYISPVAEGYETPEQLKDARAWAQYMLKQSQEQPVKHWTQGLANMTRALVGGTTDWNTQQAEARARNEAAAGFVRAFGQPSNRPPPPPRLSEAEPEKGPDAANPDKGKPVQVASLDGAPTPDTSEAGSPALTASVLDPGAAQVAAAARTNPALKPLPTPAPPTPSAIGEPAAGGGIAINPQLLAPRARVSPGIMYDILRNPQTNPQIAALLAQQYISQGQNQTLDYPGVGTMYYSPEGQFLGLRPDITWQEIEDPSGRKMKFPFAWSMGPSGKLELKAIDLPIKPQQRAPESVVGTPPVIGPGSRSQGVVPPPIIPGGQTPAGAQPPSIPTPGTPAPGKEVPVNLDAPSLTLPGGPGTPKPQSPGKTAEPEPRKLAGVQLAYGDNDLAGLFTAPPEGGAAPGQLAYTAEDFMREGKTKADIKGEETAAVESEKSLRDSLNKYTEAGQKALAGIQRTDEARRNLEHENFVWGPQAAGTLAARKTRAWLGGQLGSLGVEGMGEPGSWTDVAAATPNDQFRKNMEEIAMQKLRDAFGGLGQVRVAEIQMLQAALANEQNTPQANRNILALMRRGFEDATIMGKIANAYEQGVRWDKNGEPVRDANGNLTISAERPTKKGLDAVIQQYVERNPLLSEEETQFLQKPEFFTREGPTAPVVPEAAPPNKGPAPPPPAGSKRKRWE